VREAVDGWLDLGMFEFTGNGIDLVRLISSNSSRAFKPEDVKFEVMRADGTSVRSTVLVKPAEVR
jgi:hypothetical protein